MLLGMETMLNRTTMAGDVLDCDPSDVPNQVVKFQVSYLWWLIIIVHSLYRVYSL